MHALRHSADELRGVAAPMGVPLRIMSGSTAVGRFIMKVTAPGFQVASVETARVKAAMGRADLSMSLTLYLVHTIATLVLVVM